MHHAEMVWLDSQGVDFRGHTVRGERASVRHQFTRPALNDFDAISMITMAGQQAWEADRKYTPTIPVLSPEVQV